MHPRQHLVEPADIVLEVEYEHPIGSEVCEPGADVLPKAQHADTSPIPEQPPHLRQEVAVVACQ